MTPAEFVNKIVLPTVLELRADTRSRRLSYLACIAVFHVKHHLVRAGETEIESALRVATGDAFDVVRGFCNGTKQFATNGSHVVAFTAGDDTDRPPMIFGEAMFGVSMFGDSKDGRDVSTPAGRADVYEAVSATLKAFVASYPLHLSGCNLSTL